MYGWIWRTLPGGLVGKLLGSTVLALLAVLLLFFVVFPAVEPLLPYDDVTVGDGAVLQDPAGGGASGGGAPPAGRS